MMAKESRSDEHRLVAQEIAAACRILGKQLLSQLLEACSVKAWRNCIPDLQQGTTIGNRVETGLNSQRITARWVCHTHSVGWSNVARSALTLCYFIAGVL